MAQSVDPRERLRRMCLSLPETGEVQAWGDPTYRIRNKIFAMEKGAGTEVWFKGTPGAQEAMVASEPGCYFVPPYVGHKGWVGARLDSVPDWGELAELIADSYRLIAPKKLAAQVSEAPASAGEPAPAGIALRPIGYVSSPVLDPGDAARQPDEGAPPAWLDIDDAFEQGLRNVNPGDDLVVVTWLHRADREILAVHPRGDAARPVTGVFSTRSEHRPNPIGLHRVRVLERNGCRIRVDHLEAVDGTPVLDLKASLGPLSDR